MTIGTYILLATRFCTNRRMAAWLQKHQGHNASFQAPCKSGTLVFRCSVARILFHNKQGTRMNVSVFRAPCEARLTSDLGPARLFAHPPVQCVAPSSECCLGLGLGEGLSTRQSDSVGAAPRERRLWSRLGGLVSTAAHVRARNNSAPCSDEQLRI